MLPRGVLMTAAISSRVRSYRFMNSRNRVLKVSMFCALPFTFLRGEITVFAPIRRPKTAFEPGFWASFTLKVSMISACSLALRA